MPTITVKESGSNIYAVTVTEGGSSQSYRVTVPDETYQKLTQGKISKADCVKSSFKFLLDRESKESILSSFDLPVIGRYFPEYYDEYKYSCDGVIKKARERCRYMSKTV